MKSTLLFLLWVTTSLQLSFGQYKSYLYPENKNTTVIRHFPDRITSEATYLGSFSHQGERFHVIKEFFKVQAAISIHGHSFVFILSQGRIIKTFEFNSPDELPNRSNSFYCYFNRERISLIENNQIIDVICTSKSGCIFCNESQ